VNIFIHYFADSYRKKNFRNLIRFLSKQANPNFETKRTHFVTKEIKIFPPPTCWERNWISQIWAAKIMPNLVTVKLYLQIKVIPLSMSLMLNTKASVNSCLVFLKGKKETRWILLVWILIVSNIYDPCLSKSWTQLSLKRPNYTWSETEVGRQFRCWTCVQTNNQANLEEKYQMKSHPALNFELKKEEKTRQIEMEVEKKNVGNY